MGRTTNLNLFIYDPSVDGVVGYDKFRDLLLGSGSSSNMNLIDSFAGELLLDVPNLVAGYSASETSISASLTSSSAQVEASGSQISDIATRFEVIDNFSSSGYVDFSGISQDYTHLLVIGNASTEYPDFISRVGIDFNGDATTTNYYNAEWVRSGSSYPYGEDTIITGSTCLLVGNVSGCVSGCGNQYYGGSVYFMIPNYSGSTSFYKTAMGLSSLSQDVWRASSLSSGVWKATDPINRVRMFGVDGSGSRYGFIDGTEITIYGIE